MASQQEIENGYGRIERIIVTPVQCDTWNTIYEVDCANIGSDAVVQIPQASGHYNTNILIVKVDSSPYKVTVIPFGSETINKETSIVLTQQDQCINVLSVDAPDSIVTFGLYSKMMVNIINAGADKIANSATSATNLATPNTIVARDASGNFIANNISLGLTNIIGSATIINMTVASSRTQVITGSVQQKFNLTDARTLANGTEYYFSNQSTAYVVINYNDGTTNLTYLGQQDFLITLTDNSTANGSWIMTALKDNLNIYTQSATLSNKSFLSLFDASISALVGTMPTPSISNAGALFKVINSATSIYDVSIVGLSNATNLVLKPKQALIAQSDGVRWYVVGQYGDNTKQDIITGGATGNIVTRDSNGQVIDSGVGFGNDGTNNTVPSSGQMQTYVTQALLNTPSLPAVNYASTANITTFSGLGAIDGYTPTAGQALLVKNQTNGDNSVWLVASTAWTRAYNNSGVWSPITTQTKYGQLEINGGIVNVLNGTVGKNLQYQFNIVNPSATFGNSIVYVTALTKLPVASPTNIYADGTTGNDTNNNGSQSFPVATLTRALALVTTTPAVVNLMSNSTFAAALSFTNAKTNITFQGNNISGNGGMQTISGQQTFGSGSTYIHWINTYHSTGATAPFSFASGSLARNIFKNITINSTAPDWLGLNAGMFNFIQLEDVTFQNPGINAINLPAFTNPFTIYVNSQNIFKGAMFFIGTGAVNTQIVIENEINDGAVRVPPTYLGTITWGTNAFGATLGSIARPVGLITNQTDLTTVLSWTTNSTYDGFYAITGFTPTAGNFTRGSIFGKQTGGGFTNLWWARTPQYAPAVVKDSTKTYTFNFSTLTWSAISSGGGGVASVTLAQRLVISTQQTVYNSTLGLLETYSGTAWSTNSVVNIVALNAPTYTSAGLYIVISGTLPTATSGNAIGYGDIFYFDGATSYYQIYNWANSPVTIYLSTNQTLLKSNSANGWYYAPTAPTVDVGVNQGTQVTGVNGSTTTYNVLQGDSTIYVNAQLGSVIIQLPQLSTVAITTRAKYYNIVRQDQNGLNVVILRCSSGDSFNETPYGDTEVFMQQNTSMTIRSSINAVVGNTWNIDSLGGMDYSYLTFNDTITATRTLTRQGGIYAVSATSNITITLPPSTFGAGAIKFTRIDNNTLYTVTLLAPSGHTINGLASILLQCRATVTTRVLQINNVNQVAEISSSNASSVISPSFSAYQSVVHNLTGNSRNLMLMQTKTFDTATCFNNSNATVTLNGLSVPRYSFCPNVAGYYQISTTARTTVGAGETTSIVLKNGADIANGSGVLMTAGQNFSATCSTLVYLNGTGDYVQSAVWVSANCTTDAAFSTFCWFTGTLVTTGTNYLTAPLAPNGAMSGIKYATSLNTEVQTQDVWMNGQPIYMKTITFTNKPNDNSNNLLDGQLTPTYAPNIINIYGAWKDGATVMINSGSTSAVFCVQVYQASNGLIIQTGTGRSSVNTGYVTVYYTKT